MEKKFIILGLVVILFFLSVGFVEAAVCSVDIPLDSEVGCDCGIYTANPSNEMQRFCCDYNSDSSYELGPVRCEHPRIFVNEDDLLVLKNSYENRIPGDYWNDFLDMYQSTNGCYDSDGDGGALCNAFMYLLTNDSQYAENALDTCFEYQGVYTMCYRWEMDGTATYTPKNYVFNNVGYSMMARALVYDWLYDYSGFTQSMKEGWLDWFNRWNTDGTDGIGGYSDTTFMNGQMKLMSGIVPIWFATYGNDRDNNEYDETVNISAAQQIPGEIDDTEVIYLIYSNRASNGCPINDLQLKDAYDVPLVLDVDYRFTNSNGRIYLENNVRMSSYDQNYIIAEHYSYCDINEDLPFYLSERWNITSLTWDPNSNVGLRASGYLPMGQQYTTGSVGRMAEILQMYQSAEERDLLDDTLLGYKNILEASIHEYYYDSNSQELLRAEYGKGTRSFTEASSYGIVTNLYYLSRKYNDEQFARYVWKLFEGIPDFNNGQAIHGNHAFKRSSLFYTIVRSLYPSEISADYGSLPLSYYNEKYPVLFMRSNWDQPGNIPLTYTTFKAADLLWFNQNQYDQGTFNIKSHGGNLAADTGRYPGDGSDAGMGYQSRTIAHNSLLIKDPIEMCGWGELTFSLGSRNHCNTTNNDLPDGFRATEANDGGQRTASKARLLGALFNGEQIPNSAFESGAGHVHDVSNTLAQESVIGEYDYIASDITRAYASPFGVDMFDLSDNSWIIPDWIYRPKVDQVEREFIYLRNPTDLDNEYFIVFDRINDWGDKTGDVNVGGSTFNYDDVDRFNKSWLIHSLDQPQISGTIVDSVYSGRYETFSGGDEIIITQNTGKLFVKTLLPDQVYMTRIGNDFGSGAPEYYHWNDGVNWEYSGHTYEAGNWRVEVAPVDQTQTFTNFLHVMHPTWATETNSPTQSASNIISNSGNVEGVVIDASTISGNDKTVIFSKYGAEIEIANYTYTSSGLTNHLVVNLRQNVGYDISINGVPTYTGLISSGQGTLSFDIDQIGSVDVNLMAGDAVLCSDLGGVVCGGGETCNDQTIPAGDGDCCVPPAQCMVCSLSNSYWADNSGVSIEGNLILEGTSVYQRMNTSSCSGQLINLSIWEDDILSEGEPFDEFIGSILISVPSNDYIINEEWVTRWMGDIVGDPEYYFKGEVVGNEVVNDKSGLINVDLDETPPVISNINAELSPGSAIITWTTDKSGDSTVNYGETLSYGNTESSPEYITSHSITLPNLNPGTLYYYEIVSCTSGGYCNTPYEDSFTTPLVANAKLYPLEDTYISNTGTGNEEVIHGSSDYLELDAEVGSGGRGNILMKFNPLDLSGISEIDSAILYLYTEDVVNPSGLLENIRIYPMNENRWTESGANYFEWDYSGGALINKWSGTDAYTGYTWTLFPPTDYVDVIIYEGAHADDNGVWHSFNVTELVQGWINGGYDVDAGLMMISPNVLGVSNTYEFVSSEHPSSEFAPYIDLFVSGVGACTPGDVQNCPLQNGICLGSQETCDAGGNWPGCDASTYLNYNGFYEDGVEVTCDDTLDNDCDALTDASDSDCSGVPLGELAYLDSSQWSDNIDVVHDGNIIYTSMTYGVQAWDTSDINNPVLVSDLYFEETPDENIDLTRMDLYENYLGVVTKTSAASPNDFYLVDISNPENMFVVDSVTDVGVYTDSSYSDIKFKEQSGTPYVYVVTGTGIYVYEVGPQLTFVDNINFGIEVYSLSIIGSRALVLSENGVFTVDIADPSNLIQTNSLDFETPLNSLSLRSIDVDDGWGVVAASSLGFHTFSFSNPDNPSWEQSIVPVLGDTTATMRVQDARVFNNMLYLVTGTATADGQGGIGVYDLSSPLNSVPDYYGENRGWGDVEFMDYDPVRDLIYFAQWHGGNAGIMVNDISDLNNIVQTGQTRNYDYCRGVHYSNGVVYCSTGHMGLIAHRFVNDELIPASIVPIGQSQGHGTWGIDVVGDIAYAIATDDGLVTINFSDPDDPLILGSVSELENVYARDVEIIGNIAYVAVRNLGIASVDISNLTNPILLDVEKVSVGNPMSMNLDISGNVVATADRENGVNLWNVSDPANILHLATYPPISKQVFDVDFYGNYLFVSESNSAKSDHDVYVLDVSDPINPSLYGVMNVDTNCGLNCPDPIFVEGDGLYLAKYTQGINVYDLSGNILNPTIIDSYNTGDKALDIYSVDSKVIVADNFGLTALQFGGEVQQEQCQLTNAYWNSDTVDDIVDDNTSVTLTLEGINCVGEQINFTIYEDDLVLDDLVTSQVDTYASTIWMATWTYNGDDDIGSDPRDYYFKSVLVSNESISYTSVDMLQVQQVIVPICDDLDGDGYNITGGDCGPIDCDDNNIAIWQYLLGYPDGDSDSYYSPISEQVCSGKSLPLGYSAIVGDDCNDNNDQVNPGANEVCDNIDNDCDVLTEDGIDESWYGQICDGSDSDLCDEGNYECSVGQQICSDITNDDLEVCNGADDDCNLIIDDNILPVSCGTGLCTGQSVCSFGNWTDCSTNGTNPIECILCDEFGNENILNNYCYIDSLCYSDGENNTANECELCNSSSSQSSWDVGSCECSVNEDCGVDSIGNWSDSYCVNNDVYHNRMVTNYTCDSGFCDVNYTTEDELIDSCSGDSICENGECVSTVSEFGIFLESGWNYISVPVDMDDTSPSQLGDIVLTYDSINKEWLINMGPINQITTLEPLKGYVVYSDSSHNISFHGLNITTPSILSSDSWNLVGIYDYGIISDFYTASENYSVYQYVSDGVIVNVTDSTLEPGVAYWVDMTGLLSQPEKIISNQSNISRTLIPLRVPTLSRGPKRSIESSTTESPLNPSITPPKKEDKPEEPPIEKDKESDIKDIQGLHSLDIDKSSSFWNYLRRILFS